MAFIDDVLAIAASQVGVKEVGRSNSGAAVNAYLKRTGLGPGYPWCQAFVYWCIDEVCVSHRVDNPYVRTASCAVAAAWATDHNVLVAAPVVGDQFLLYGRPEGYRRACHTGFVTAVANGRIETIEGNTNPGGSRDGYGVFRRRRLIDGLRFVRYAAIVQPADLPVKRIMVGGKQVGETVPMNGVSFVPIRAVAEARGHTVAWDYDLQLVRIDGEPLQAEVASLEGVAHANIHRLAGCLRAVVTDDPKHRAVIIS